tara:strand:+ start:13 stop:447 length:435 start_codon:yes stop_codon:yes gene_type:complete
MEIRALTGIDSVNLRKYGRQYTPLNGTKNVCLGSPNVGVLPSKGVEIPVEIPTYIPPQKLQMIDVKTGKKKFFTVENIQQLTELLQQGFELFDQIKGGQGKKVVVIKRSESDITPPKQAGMQIVSVLGGLVGAYILFSLLMSKK